MRRSAVLATTAAMLLGVATLSAQAANFAGHWVLVPDTTAMGGGGGGGRGFGGGGLGQEVTIAQDAKTLTITRTTQNGESKQVYNLDGSESSNTMSMRGNDMVQKSTAKWDGGKLVITTNYDMGNGPVTTTMALSMSGGNLVVETTRPGRGGGAPTTRTSTYKKG